MVHPDSDYHNLIKAVIVRSLRDIALGRADATAFLTSQAGESWLDAAGLDPRLIRGRLVEFVADPASAMPPERGGVRRRYPPLG